MGDLVAGEVGPANKTPKIVQDQRNWADAVVNEQGEDGMPAQ